MKEFAKRFKFDQTKSSWLGIENEAIVTDEEGRPKCALKVLQEVLGEQYTYLWPEDDEVMTSDVFDIISGMLHKEGIKQEMFTSQLELVCGPCQSLEEIHCQSLERRKRLLNLSRKIDGIPVYSGFPLGLIEKPEVFPAERYLRITKNVQELHLRLANGLHVHKGLASLEEGIYVLNFVAPSIPALIALSANSSVCFGQSAVEHCSKRVVEDLVYYIDLIPPYLPNIDSLYLCYKDSDWLEELWLCTWCIRVNPLGTIEIRIFDGQDSVVEEMMLVAVASALVDYARAVYHHKKKLRPPANEYEYKYHTYRSALFAAAYGLGANENRELVLRLLEDIKAYATPEMKQWLELARRRTEQGISGASAQRERWHQAKGDIRKYMQLLQEEQVRELEPCYLNQCC